MGFKKRLLLFFALIIAGVIMPAQEQEHPAEQDQAQQQEQKQEPEQQQQAAGEQAPAPEAPVELVDPRSPALFVHHLEWYPAEYSSSYVVILEQKRGEQFIEVLRRTVNETFLDISVPAGEYRYRVLGYNILGRLDSTSEWEYVTVLQAIEPSIFNFTPSNFYFDRKTLRVIFLEGINLFPDSEIYLQRRPGKDDLEFIPEENVLIPKEIRVTDLGDRAQLVFDEEMLVEGKYDIIVKNPGGFEGQTGPFGISVAKPWDLNVSAGYFPMVSLFSGKKDFFNKAGIPLVFGASASFIPIKMNFGFIGAEFHTFLGGFEFPSSDPLIHTIRANIFSTMINGLYQYWFIRDTLALNARIGLGITSILGYHYEFHTGDNSPMGHFPLFSWGLGASAQWIFYRQLYLEGGLDYFHIHDSNAPMGFLRFMVCTGWQF